MSTDRELLELAAKAAGHEYLIWTPGAAPIVPVGHRVDGRACWNPLTDDGDALRLAVKLGLMIDVDIGAGRTRAIQCGLHEDEPHGEDPLAATRRVIVFAAAEIGARP